MDQTYTRSDASIFSIESDADVLLEKTLKTFQTHLGCASVSLASEADQRVDGLTAPRLHSADRGYTGSTTDTSVRENGHTVMSQSARQTDGWMGSLAERDQAENTISSTYGSV